MQAMRPMWRWAAGVGAAVMLVGALTWRPATAQVSAEGGRYEYATLLLDDGAPVLYEATREIRLIPPRDQPNPEARQLPQLVDQYSFASQNVRHDDVAALNVFGKMGWEVLTVLTEKDGHHRAYLRRMSGR